MAGKRKITYRSAGVDIRGAERFVDFIEKRVGLDRGFGALYPLPKGLDRPVLVSSTDGVGTKLKLAFLSGRHDTVGIDLVAMNANDIVCRGARPLFFLDYIACGKLDVRVLRRVIEGIARGCEMAEMSLIGGETAEMPGFYPEGEYDLSGFCVGVVEAKDLLPRRGIKEGDLVVGLASSGLHSNGFSLVRKVFPKREILKRIDEFLTPTRIYSPQILALLKEFPGKVKQIAHITGGGFYLKAIKGIPEGLGLRFDTTSFPIPPIFSEIQERAGMSKEEMFSTFNMGLGMTLVVSRRWADKVVSFLRRWQDCWVVGEVVRARSRERVQV